MMRTVILTAMKFRSGTKSNYAAIVDQVPRVWATAEGEFSPEKALPLIAALSVARPASRIK